MYDVAVIGYGPTGATLGRLLSDLGLRVLLIEREDAAYHLPRAVHFDGEVMRVFQRAGIAEALEPLTALHPGMKFVDEASGRLLLDWPRPQGAGPQGWRSNYRFHQPELEALLRAGMESREKVTLRMHCEADRFDDRGDHVEIGWTDRVTGQRGAARARWVVGCDGARSSVRRTIDTNQEDFGFHERWLVVDVILKGEKPELGDFSVQYCSPERPMTYVRGPFRRRRWEITVLEDEDSETVARPENVRALLSRWLKPEEADLERTAVYTFHSVVAERWRRGRLLLAGDACHQTPPFMGQGMCAGIRDASNLAWKLALACRGEARDPEALIDSYESERRPNAAEYIRTAVRLGGLINASDPGAALQAAFPVGDGSARMESIAPPLGPGLGIGPLSGRLFGQPRLADGRLLDEAYPHRFVVVAQSDLASGLTVPDGVALVTTTGAPEASAHLARFGSRGVVLRPDRYTLGAGDTAEELAPVLARLSAI